MERFLCSPQKLWTAEASQVGKIPKSYQETNGMVTVSLEYGYEEEFIKALLTC